MGGGILGRRKRRRAGGPSPSNWIWTVKQCE